MNNHVQRDPDMISNVPDDVITEILACLSLKEAARTSVWSKKWRNRWISTPKLVFDDTFSSLSKSDLFKTIYRVLLLHADPITSFSLCVSGLKDCIAINHIMFLLSKRHIHELTLAMDIEHEERHELTSLFSFENLRYLKLSSCALPIPFAFEALRNLKSVDFENVDFQHEHFWRILEVCPSIEDVTVRYCCNLDDLVVGAPKLKNFSFCGHTSSLVFAMSPLLSKLHIDIFLSALEEDDLDVRGLDIIEFFACLPNLQNLSMTMDDLLLLYWNSAPIPVCLPTKLDSLKLLSLLGVSLDSLNDVTVVFCLIRSSPNLQKLEIELSGFINGSDVKDAAKFIESGDFSDAFSNLKELKMVEFEGLKNEMLFVKLVLANAPHLELLYIQHNDLSIHDENRIFGVSRFVRASSRVTFTFEGSET